MNNILTPAVFDTLINLLQVEVARRSFRTLDRNQSGFLTKQVFMDEMVRQAVSSGMAMEDAAALETELEAEFR